MASKDRLMMIRQKVRADKKVKVTELSRTYQVTEETIRRDLEKLEAEGFLTRTFGGAVLNSTLPQDNIHFYQRATIQSEEKKKIAALIYEMLKDKRTISVDSSTTAMEAIKLLKDQDMTILSVSTEIFREIENSNLKIISTGGIYNKKTLSLQGQVTKDTIKRYHVDMALISCKGLDLEKGATDTNENETEVKKCMIKQAEQVAMLVDHTKFGKTAFAKLSALDDIDFLVTDRKPDEEWIRLCQELGVQLIY